jgi:hypothetical protein
MKIFDAIKEKIRIYVVRTLVEDVPFLKKLFSFVDGHKTSIGKIGVWVSLAIAALHYAFPEIPYIGDIDLFVAALVSWLLEQIGETHRVDKELREQLFTGEFGIKEDPEDS